MSNSVIIAEHLSKSYLIGHAPGGRSYKSYTALRDVIGQEVRNFARKMRDGARGRQVFQAGETEEFWALKDVSFEVKQGEVLGIIGRNGAGKSTLLKILGRITEPTAGRVTLRGRVASLLEVGTGFHPELTGRENIFLNGAILGMSRREIRAKFDEIVTFAEVEKFLDTPVKRYSSGMYVRLAFAVAAHLEPEILVVDEVLAVGDMEFQKKCLGKMQDVASRQDRTVLFVSHNMAAVQSLCHSAILLTDGHCTSKGPVDAIVHEYLNRMNQMAAVPLSQRNDRRGSGAIRFSSVTLEGRGEKTVMAFQCGGEATLRLEVDCSVARAGNVALAAGIHDEMGQRVLLLDAEVIGTEIPELAFGRHVFKFTISRMPLVPGRYSLTLFASTNNDIADWIQSASLFDVKEGDFYGTGRLPQGAYGPGLFLVDHKLSFANGADKNLYSGEGHLGVPRTLAKKADR
jgi:lipopolysaccharide transport system ATP-binding protein